MLTLLAALYLSGVLLGTVLYCVLDSEQLEVLNGIAGSFVADRLNQGFLQTLVHSFSGVFILLLVCFLLGFSAVSQLAELAVPMYSGLGVGASLAGIYSSFGLPGVGMSAVLVIPNAVVSGFVVIIAAREAFRMSGNVYTLLTGAEAVHEKIDVRLYFTKFVILCLILAAASMVNSLLALLFAELWSGLSGA